MENSLAFHYALDNCGQWVLERGMPAFRFHTTKITPVEGKPAHFDVTAIEETGADVHEAYDKAAPKIPEGCRIWFWNEIVPLT